MEPKRSRRFSRSRCFSRIAVGRKVPGLCLRAFCIRSIGLLIWGLTSLVSRASGQSADSDCASALGQARTMQRIAVRDGLSAMNAVQPRLSASNKVDPSLLLILIDLEFALTEASGPPIRSSEAILGSSIRSFESAMDQLQVLERAIELEHERPLQGTQKVDRRHVQQPVAQLSLFDNPSMTLDLIRAVLVHFEYRVQVLKALRKSSRSHSGSSIITMIDPANRKLRELILLGTIDESLVAERLRQPRNEGRVSLVHSKTNPHLWIGFVHHEPPRSLVTGSGQPLSQEAQTFGRSSAVTDLRNEAAIFIRAQRGSRPLNPQDRETQYGSGRHQSNAVLILIEIDSNRKVHFFDFPI